MSNKKVSVFGGSGFMGSHLCDMLTDQGYNVTIFDKKKSEFLKKNQKMIIGNILDVDKVRNAIKGSKFVYNFAGISDIEYSNNNLIETINQNILSNSILLEESLNQKVNRFIFASSLYVNSLSGGNYRISKQACEEFIENFYINYGLNYSILRYGSLYGPRSDERNGIFKFIKSAINNKKMIFNGKDTSLREFIHVHDAALLSTQILENKFKNKKITITGQTSLTIKELLNLIKEILKDSKIKIVFNTKNHSSHYEVTPYTYKSDYSKKMYPKLSIDLGEGIVKMIDEVKSKSSK